MKARAFRRLLLMIIALIGLVYGFYWWINQANDFQLSSTTDGMIAAQKQTDSGSQVVVLDKDGKVIESQGYVQGAEDRDVTWDPEGNRVFFISDRKDEGFHIYRWDPQRNSNPDQKSIDRAGRSNLAFDVEKSDRKDLSALVTVRGTVQEFFPKNARSQQVLPPNPKVKVMGGDVEEGARSAMELIYKRYGTSFRAAKWFKGRRFIAGIMRREDQGETLIVQDLLPNDKGTLPEPIPLFTADKFYMDVDPATGNLVFSVMGVIPPVKDGKPQKMGFRHGIFIFDPTVENGAQPLLPIVLAPTDEASFAQLAIPRDGSKLVFTSGPYTGDGNLNVQGLASCPLQPNGGQSGSPIVNGSIADPTFSPDGTRLAFVKREGSSRAIFMSNADGSDSRNLSGSNGDFANPVFSPQYK